MEEAFVDKNRSVEIFRRGWLRAEDERTIIAIQDLALRTNWTKKHLERMNVSDRCRMCGENPELISHILSGCKILLESGLYTDRHDSVCRNIHFKLSKKFGLPTSTEHHWSYKPNSIEENERALLLYDYSIPTDNRIAHNRPDIVLHNKTESICLIIEVGVPWDTGISAYEREKELKYQTLKYEIRRMWNVQDVIVIPVVIGATGVIKKSLNDNLQKLPIQISTIELAMAVIKKSISICRRVLGYR